MAFDGVTVACLVSELNTCLAGGRIYKIYQPEADELHIVIKTKSQDASRKNVRLLMSACASLPLVYLTNESKVNPMTAPNFCMLLRKHIGNGRIVNIYQPGFERIIMFDIEHLDEMGDMRTKRLIIELMGKHSNIIFVDEDGNIIDSIKHIGAQISSVREVLPGRKYVYPPSKDKRSPFDVDKNYFADVILKKPMSISKALINSITGFSYVISQELCYRAGLDGDAPTAALLSEQSSRLWQAFHQMVTEEILACHFSPAIYMENDVPQEFSAVTLHMENDRTCKQYESVSEMLYDYYAMRDTVSRIHQKSSDLRKIVSNLIERVSKKYDLQAKKLRDTEHRDKYRVYGELLNTYGYSITSGADSFVALNYYDGREITIPLDKNLSALDNAKRYFAKYNKMKRTYEALTTLVEESKEELSYLMSVQNSLDIARTEGDLKEIKQELMIAGYIRQKNHSSKQQRIEKSRPMHYVSSDGFDIYVGKNNLQNEEITFKLASGTDLWFHAKQIPGSHVIVKLNGKKDVPDSTYEEAGRLAAYYSSGRQNPKVEIDYTKRQQLKKPAGAKPGFVIYHTNYSMVSIPDIKGIQMLS